MKTFALLLATITTGLMSGVYASYAFSVMPGLRGVDDRTFVDVMQRFNVAIGPGPPRSIDSVRQGEMAWR